VNFFNGIFTSFPKEYFNHLTNFFQNEFRGQEGRELEDQSGTKGKFDEGDSAYQSKPMSPLAHQVWFLFLKRWGTKHGR